LTFKTNEEFEVFQECSKICSIYDNSLTVVAEDTNG